MARIEQEVLQPAIATLRQRGIDIEASSAGLMITADGDLKVLNLTVALAIRKLVILPLLETPLSDLLFALPSSDCQKCQIT